jgi:hypothetical protein
MAIGIDLGFVALEGAAAQFDLGEATGARSSKYTKPAIIGTLRLRRHEPSRPAGRTSGRMTGATSVLGLAIPARLDTFTRIGCAMHINSRNK